MERRLAAILAADVVGYSRHMGVDEAATLAALKLHRTELIDPKSHQYHGRTVKLMGDGTLMEFASAVDAVTFAIEVQFAMRQRNADIPPEHQIVYRIGINIGDIIIEGDDIFGDGVNIAARLEGLAEPGGICVARNVFSQVKSKLDLSIELIGEREVKNIAEPVVVHRVLLDDKAEQLVTEIQVDAVNAPKRRGVAVATCLSLIMAGVLAWWQPWVTKVDSVPVEKTASAVTSGPTIAVLPFANMSEEKNQDYFSDGLSEDLITDLSKLSGLNVVARNSTFSFKGQAIDVRKIADELGAQFVVEGSVRRAGGRVRITAQLIDANSGHHVWAERYDREMSDIFELQDDVRKQIISALAIQLTPSQKARFSHRKRISVDAYELLLRGIAQEGYFTKQANAESRRLFQQVITLESDFAEAHARLANSYDIAFIMDWIEDPKASLEQALAAALKAVDLDPTLPYAHWSLGRVYTHLSRHEEAIAALKEAIRLAPNYADAYAYLSLVYSYSGKADKGSPSIEKALSLNPKAPYWYYYVHGLSLYLQERHKDAVPVLEHSIEANSNVIWARHYLIAAYGHLGEIDEAQWQIDELSVQGYEVTISKLRKLTSIRDDTYLERYLVDLRKAGVPE